MKKIIFIANNNLGDGLSGGDRIFLEFLRNWQNKAQITVIACQEAINLINLHHIKNVTLICTTNKLETSNYFSNKNLLKHILKRTFIGIKSIYQHRQLIKKSDFIYSVSDFYPDFFPSLTAKLLSPKSKLIIGYYLFAPHPFSKDSPYKNTNFTKGLLYWLMQRPSHFLTNVFADIVFITSKPDIKNFPKKRTFIIQGGVDTKPSQNYFKTNKIIKKKKYDAIFIGRLHPQKGVLELIDIWKNVVQKKPNAKLAIIGDGELEKQLKSKISKLKLKKNINLLGFLDGQEKYKIFKQSKVVVHPAVYDSGGMAAAEAMAWGLPGVSFDLKALKTYYPKGMIKTKCFNLNNFADNIISLLEDSKKYEKFSKEAKQLILEKWDWQKRNEYFYKKVFKI